MINGKRGSVFFVVAIGLFVFVLGVLIIPFFTEEIPTTRINLNCSGADTITDGTMIQCLMIDALIPYFIWFFCSLAIGIFFGVGK